MGASGSQPADVATVAGVEVFAVLVVAAAAAAAVVVVAAAVVVVAAADDDDDDEGQVSRLKLVVVGLLDHRQGLFLFQSSLIELEINFRWLSIRPSTYLRTLNLLKIACLPD